jgi:hypothetical protein
MVPTIHTTKSGTKTWKTAGLQAFQEHVQREMKQYNVDNYINFGGQLDDLPWRTYEPRRLFEVVDNLLNRRLGLPETEL